MLSNPSKRHMWGMPVTSPNIRPSLPSQSPIRPPRPISQSQRYSPSNHTLHPSNPPFRPHPPHSPHPSTMRRLRNTSTLPRCGHPPPRSSRRHSPTTTTPARQRRRNRNYSRNSPKHTRTPPNHNLRLPRRKTNYGPAHCHRTARRERRSRAENILRRRICRIRNPIKRKQRRGSRRNRSDRYRYKSAGGTVHDDSGCGRGERERSPIDSERRPTRSQRLRAKYKLRVAIRRNSLAVYSQWCEGRRCGDLGCGCNGGESDCAAGDEDLSLAVRGLHHDGRACHVYGLVGADGLGADYEASGGCGCDFDGRGACCDDMRWV
ncbi:hypothetical protein K432DRAFT_33386 [Lepidopterella palustris CBS 459.81]|uniref:Uncharacterized protein n=1 Tax=Lepidopterella palustris CBS 459.81 TaxID=1314670 RepID=A0A8E2EBA9_9PEZI|nr:hypothetical protein K432DRAFT_33386 [Lepidopterella palustris CBS 459.81]